MKYQKALWLALTGIALAGLVHLINGFLSGLPLGMHTTADDASYLVPAENWWHSGIWKDNSTGVSSYIQRPPMMGVIHLIAYVPFGKLAPAAHFIFCLLLHGWSLYRLPRLLSRFLPEKQAFRAAWVYAVLPCFWGFLSYQITESVSPALVLLVISFLYAENKPGSSMITLLLFATVLWFLRPLLVLLFLLPLVMYIRKHRSSLRLIKNTGVFLLCLLAVFAWEFRKAGYSGKWGDLHPIYHAENASLYRPPHAALSDLFRIWETRPEVFHAIAHSCWGEDSTLRSPEYLAGYIRERNVPLSVGELESLLAHYASVNRPVAEQVSAGKPVAQTHAERAFIRKTDQLSHQLKRSHALQYHLKTPLISVKEMLSKSQLNMELFQVQFRGNFLVELLRYLCVLIINLLVIGTLLTFFRRKTELRWLAAGIVLFGFYLFYVQRLNEDRYLIPALPLLFVTGSVYWLQLIGLLRRKQSN